MEIKKINNNHLEGFAELIRGASINEGACCEIMNRPNAQSMILEGLLHNARRLSKISAETGDDYYVSLAGENRRLWKELRIAFGIEEENE
jgi:hypothetical protein